VHTLDLEDRILTHVTKNLATSARRIAAVDSFNQLIVSHILHEQCLYSYHLQQIPGLHPEDFLQQMDFYQLLQQQYAVSPGYPLLMLFTDTGFTCGGITSSLNSHVWADKNSHTTFQSRHQHQFTINLWTGILEDRCIVPYVFL
jgi:hypothetical protein